MMSGPLAATVVMALAALLSAVGRPDTRWQQGLGLGAAFAAFVLLVLGRPVDSLGLALGLAACLVAALLQGAALLSAAAPADRLRRALQLGLPALVTLQAAIASPVLMPVTLLATTILLAIWLARAGHGPTAATLALTGVFGSLLTIAGLLLLPQEARAGAVGVAHNQTMMAAGLILPGVALLGGLPPGQAVWRAAWRHLPSDLAGLLGACASAPAAAMALRLHVWMPALPGGVLGWLGVLGIVGAGLAVQRRGADEAPWCEAWLGACGLAALGAGLASTQAMTGTILALALQALLPPLAAVGRSPDRRVWLAALGAPPFAGFAALLLILPVCLQAPGGVLLLLGALGGWAMLAGQGMRHMTVSTDAKRWPLPLWLVLALLLWMGVAVPHGPLAGLVDTADLRGVVP